MTKRQQKIFDGLKLIGEDLSGFYRGGLEVLYSHNPVKAHLLAHCGRELDGIMRDTFSYKVEKDDIQKNLKNNQELSSFKDLIGKKDINGNVASILSALDVSMSSSLAKKWITVSTQFADYVHRDSERKIPRKFEECEKLWETYEDILYELVGNFNSIRSRVIRIIDRPNEQIIDRLPSLFKSQALKFEFYKELKSSNWLIPLYEKGFFNPANIENEYPSDEDINRLVSPNWIELFYLIRIAQVNSDSPQPEITKCLISFIKAYLEYRDEKGNAIKNSLTDSRLIDLIINLRTDTIQDEHLEFIFKKTDKNSLITYDLVQHFIPKLVKEDAKPILFKVIIFFLKPHEILQNNPINDLFYEDEVAETNDFRTYRDYDSVLTENHHLDIFYEKIPLFAEKYGLEIFELLKKFISERITSKHDFLFDTSNIPNIDTTENDYYYRNGTYKIIVQTGYKLLFHTKSDISESLKSLLNFDVEIYQRIALQIIADKYDEYNSIFWSSFTNLINKVFLEFEFSLFIKNNISKFSDSEIELLINIIETYDCDYYYNNEYSVEENEEYRCFNILKFLNILKIRQLPTIDSKIEYYVNQSKRDLSDIESDFDNESKATWSSIDPIPESALSFNEKTTGEIFEYLANFDEKDRFGRSLKGGAYQALCNDIVENPKKYFSQINTFLNIESGGFEQVINAIEILGNNKEEPFSFWKESLEYIEQWLSNNSYSNESVFRTVLKLIENFTKNDLIAFDILLMPIAKNILLNISHNVKPETTNIQKIEHNLLNIDYTRFIHSVMSFSLRDARINKKNQEEKWDIDIKNWIERELKTNPSIDLHMALGLYLTNFDFLSKDWLSSNIDILLPKNDIFWISTLSTNTFYEGINSYTYKKFINHDDYVRVFEYEGDFVKLDSLQARIIHNICWFYFARVVDESSKMGLMEKSKPILDKVINNGKPKHLEAIIHNLIIQWSSKEQLQTHDSDFRYIIGKLFEVLKANISNTEYQFLMGQLSETVSLLSELDEEGTNWMKFSISYLNIRGNTENVITGLKLHCPKNLIQVGEILISFSKNYNGNKMRLYGLEDLKYIIDLLYNKGHIEIADEVCDNFGNMGFHELKSVYYRYHPI